MKRLSSGTKEALKERKRNDQRRRRAKIKETGGIRKKRRVRQDKNRVNRKYYARKSLNTPTKIFKRYRKLLKKLDVWLVEFIGKEFDGNIDEYEKSHKTKRWKWGGRANSWDAERQYVHNIIQVITLQMKYNFEYKCGLTKSLKVVYDGQDHNMQIPVEGKKLEMADSVIFIHDQTLYYWAYGDYQSISENFNHNLVNIKKPTTFRYLTKDINDILLSYNLKITL